MQKGEAAVASPFLFGSKSKFTPFDKKNEHNTLQSVYTLCKLVYGV